MEIKANVTQRKELVRVLSEYFGQKAVYAGPPTFAYKIGAVTIDRNGLILLEDGSLKEEIMKCLAENGMVDEAPEETAGNEEEATETEPETLTVRIPLKDMTPHGIINLINMLHSKQHLINRSIRQNGFSISDSLVEELNAQTFEDTKTVTDHIMERGDCIGIAFVEGDIIFAGFPYPQERENTMLYAKLAAAMTKKANAQKRVSPKATIETNEKYYMRAWLVSLGFGGREGKEVRNFFLKDLKGHTAFRTAADEEKWKANRKAEKEAETCLE